MKLLHATRPSLRRVSPEFDRLFERSFPEQFMGNLSEPVEAVTDWMPTWDVTETDNEYILRLEAPGLHKENMDVKLSGDLLTVTGRRERIEEKRGETYLWKEREVGNFVRSMWLPAAVLEAEIEANYEDGVLTIRLPKVAKAIESKISIK